MQAFKSPLQLDSNGQISIVSDFEALVEKIHQRLQFFKASWFLDVNEGVPYLEEILTIPVDPGIAASIINNEIMKESGVLSIGEVETDLDETDRQFTYTATINTIYGSTEVSL